MVSNSIIVESLNPALGAKVKGVDFRSPLTPEVVSQIHNAWMEYQVLVFPSQSISDEQHVAVTKYFGEPEVFHQNIIKSKFVNEIFRVSNTDENGNLMPPSDPIQQQLSSAKNDIQIQVIVKFQLWDLFCMALK